MAPWRLAVAILVPASVARELDVLRRALGTADLDIVAPHLTLVPPVNVRSADLEAALGLVRAAAAETEPFAVELGPVTSFDPVTPTIHLAVADQTDASRLHALRAAVFQTPLWRRIDHDFVPHVTLAEQAPLHRIGAAKVALASYRAPLLVERLTILSERRGQDGIRRWRPLADVDLDGVRIVGRGGLPLELISSTLLDPVTAAQLGLGLLTESHDLVGAPERYGPPRERTAASPLIVVARREGRAVGAAWSDELGGYQADDESVAALLQAEWRFRSDQRAWRAGTRSVDDE